MAFIVEQQAQTFAKINATRRGSRSPNDRWTRAEEGIRAVVTIAESHERKISAQREQISAHGEQTAAQSQQDACSR